MTDPQQHSHQDSVKARHLSPAQVEKLPSVESLPSMEKLPSMESLPSSESLPLQNNLPSINNLPASKITPHLKQTIPLQHPSPELPQLRRRHTKAKWRSFALLFLTSASCLFLVYALWNIFAIPHSNTASSQKSTQPIPQGIIPQEAPAPAQKPIARVTLGAVGDIMCHLGQAHAAYNAQSKSYNFDASFADVAAALQGYDLALGNLETVTRKNTELSGFPAFNSPLELLDAIKKAGFDVLSTSNNHSFDQGEDGVYDTFDGIVERGMYAVGTHKASKRPNPLILEKNNIKIGILAYTSAINQGFDPKAQRIIDHLNKETIQKDTAWLKEQHVDFIISYVHWGTEYATRANDYQKTWAKVLADNGVGLILGSHPHVIQDTEIVTGIQGNKTYVIYSMGNFISNQRLETVRDENTEHSMIFEATLEKREGQTQLTNVNVRPCWVYRKQLQQKLHFAVVDLHGGDTASIKQRLVEKGGLAVSDDDVARMDKAYKTTKGRTEFPKA